MATDDLQELYAWFDQLIDLNKEQRQAKLEEIRAQHESIAAQLEALLGFDDPSEHSTDGLLGRLSDKLPLQHWLEAPIHSTPLLRQPSDLRELVGLFRWDQKTKQFYAGDYRIGKCLAYNSHTATYFAEDSVLGRRAVVTFAFPRYLQDVHNKDQFLDSAKVVSDVTHPNVATLFGVIQHGKLLGIARQWITGCDLAQWLRTHSPVPLASVAVLLQRITEGLSAIHHCSALHGDLKPTNIIMRDGQSTPVITDFGTVFRFEPTATGSQGWRGGTPGYIAPEIAEQHKLDQRLDLFSLGKVLHDLLDAAEKPDSSDVKYELEKLRDDLTATNPEDRPPSCQAVLERMVRLTGIPTAAWPASTSLQSRPVVLANAALWTRRAVLGASATVLPFWIGRRFHQQQLEKDRPERHFIPGKKEDAQLQIRLNPHNHSMVFQNDLPIFEIPVPDIRQALQDRSCLYLKPGIRSGKRESERLSLPSQRIRWNSLFSVAMYNTAPEAATLRIEVRAFSGPDKQKITPWYICAVRQNYFGGLALRNLVGTVNRSLLNIDAELQFRFSFELKQAWSGIGLPPLILIVERPREPLGIVGEFNLWFEESA